MNLQLKSFFSALCFSSLFYQNSFGINLLFMAFVVIILLLNTKRENMVPTVYLVAYIGTAVVVFFDPTDFKIFIHFFTFIVLAGKWVSPSSSLYLCWLMGLLNMIMASVIRYFANLGKPKLEKKLIPSKNWGYLKGVIVALLLLWIFTLLYRKANPIFEEVMKQVNLNFITLPWLFFTLLGYFLSLHLLRPYYPIKVIELDKKQSNQLIAPEAPFTGSILKKLEGEQSMGCIIFGALNVLLIFFLITDWVYLAHNNVLSNAVYSQSVHQGVYALILSIVCAIIIILYFFRGPLNFMENNIPLKTLTNIWIALNLMLVLFTCHKNYQYVEALGLTYKRLGVFMFLILVLSGLITATLKVAKTRTFMYLVRANSMAFFVFLLLSACIPWDRAITTYNLAHLTNPDITYLLELGDTNSAQLYFYAKQTADNLPKHYLGPIQEKYWKFKSKEAQKSWQEYTVYSMLYGQTKSP